jgi:hypothetical protein
MFDERYRPLRLGNAGRGTTPGCCANRRSTCRLVIPTPPTSGASGTCVLLTMCAADKQTERRFHRKSTLERGVVKQPPYLDLVTGEGVEHGGKGPHEETHNPRGGSSEAG